MPNIGMVEMEDAETGEILVVNTASKKARLSYEKQYRDKVNYFKDIFFKCGSGTVKSMV